MIKAILPNRISDSHGQGHFGASRGKRKHRGVDKLCLVDSIVLSSTSGTVTKLGIAYKDDHQFRYVEVTDDGYHYRYFYIKPCVSVGDQVTKDSALGRLQDISLRYKGMPTHLHFEIKRVGSGEYLNPSTVLIESGWMA